MDVREILSKLRNIKDVVFSSVDFNGVPKSRVIDIMLVENEKVYFVTARGKDFYREIMNNNNVSVTALTKDYMSITLEGKAFKTENQKYWIDKVFENNPTMNDVYPGQSRYILEAFCIEKGIVHTFDLSKHPIVRKTYSLGGEKTKPEGYIITDKCIQCGKCFRLCPQSSIKKNEDFEIISKNCLRCGYCYENCPVKAIERL
ncbi:4Fe-4S binding protein [Anaerofustis stercorihominis]|uniref:4Fe-4S binding protein n=1 Tax=Anaerofustis stercorihominis TaxID=214853 RepID=UPI0011062270|nr:4Fe-4S binding protein [Anaerofustis stercorihominis]